MSKTFTEDKSSGVAADFSAENAIVMAALLFFTLQSLYLNPQYSDGSTPHRVFSVRNGKTTW